MEKVCPICSTIFITYPSRIGKGYDTYCSYKCMGLARRQKVARTCIVCGKQFKVKPSAIKHSGAKYCSHRCMWIGQRGERPSIQGNKHHNWQGGIQFLPYPSKFNDELKEQIRRRDNYICRLCGVTNEEHILIYGYELVPHHIDYIKKNCDKNNLVSLCIQCNSRVNFNRAYWIDFFQNVLKKEEKVK